MNRLNELYKYYQVTANILYGNIEILDGTLLVNLWLSCQGKRSLGKCSRCYPPGAGVQLKVLKEDSKLAELIKTYQTSIRWVGLVRLAAIYLTPLYDGSFLYHRGSGLAAGLLPCLISPGGDSEKQSCFLDFRQDYSIFQRLRSFSLGCLVTLLSSNRRTSIRPNAAIVNSYLLQFFAFLARHTGGIG